MRQRGNTCSATPPPHTAHGPHAADTTNGSTDLSVGPGGSPAWSPAWPPPGPRWSPASTKTKDPSGESARSTVEGIVQKFEQKCYQCRVKEVDSEDIYSEDVLSI